MLVPVILASVCNCFLVLKVCSICGSCWRGHVVAKLLLSCFDFKIFNICEVRHIEECDPQKLKEFIKRADANICAMKQHSEGVDKFCASSKSIISGLAENEVY